MDRIWKPKAIEDLSSYDRSTVLRLQNNSLSSTLFLYNGVPCQRFLGADRRGYGQIWYVDKLVYCHRLSAHIFFGFDLESLLLVCHHCDVRSCWEPLHLFIGTNQDNILDAASKGRLAIQRPRELKESCINGHALEGDNLVIEYAPDRPNPRRRCKICKNETLARHRAKYVR